jgi:hypothetical protein
MRIVEEEDLVLELDEIKRSFVWLYVGFGL